MRVMRFVCAATAAGMLLGPATAYAQDTPQALRQEIDQLRRDFEALKQQYGDRLTALETKLAAAEGAPAAQPPAGAPPAAPPAATPPAQQPTAQIPPGAEGAGGPTGALPIYGGAAASSKVFNPDMAVIGDFLGAAGHNTVNPSPSMEMHESEAAFQAVVDPYARADFFLSFGEEGVNLEEGFVTLTSLPGGLLTKVGKMRSAFGKVNTLHNHVLPWADRPLVTQNLVGGEDGINDAGISVARLIPNPWVFLEATGQVFRGDSADVFSASQRDQLSYVGHLRGYQDISESTNIDLGFSYAHGHNGVQPTPGDTNTLTTNLYGIDATLRWRPLQRAIYHSFIGRGEWIWSRRDQLNGLQPAFGYYVSGDYQFARRWFTGLRFDRSGRATDASQIDTGGALTLTYWPSEFSQVRGEYRLINYALGDTAHELLFQFQFSIGAHGAHPF
ncbi:MAG TPA: hypothetical protein VKE96_01675 [Vicinamibacterales bacterium]|nr:hypothetical protein [Vicinamibacterales bacterium]